MPERYELLSLLGNRRFLAVAGCTSAMLVLACLLAPPALRLAALGIAVSLTLAAVLTQKGVTAAGDSDLIQQSFLIARDEQGFRLLQAQTGSLARTVQHADPLFRSLACKRLTLLANEADDISRGTIVYQDTETWRLAYEQLLRSPGLYRYRSAALVTSPSYWQDEPGRQSMRLNYELQGAGTLSIERTVLIADPFWPANEPLPSEPLQSWIDDQHRHGILLRLVRLSALVNEPDLHADSGIYGSRAVGVQELTPSSKTLRFVLSFDFNRVREAEERWERLLVYATSYGDLLDRSEFDL